MELNTGLLTLYMWWQVPFLLFSYETRVSVVLYHLNANAS